MFAGIPVSPPPRGRAETCARRLGAPVPFDQRGPPWFGPPPFFGLQISRGVRGAGPPVGGRWGWPPGASAPQNSIGTSTSGSITFTPVSTSFISAADCSSSGKVR